MISWSFLPRYLGYVSVDDAAAHAGICDIIFAPGGLRAFAEAVPVHPAAAVRDPDGLPPPAGLDYLGDGLQPRRNTHPSSLLLLESRVNITLKPINPLLSKMQSV
jgi:hypothetical protein